jgi:hypothetical protein
MNLRKDKIWNKKSLVFLYCCLCLSSFTKRTYISSPDKPQKTIEVRLENLMYKMAKLIIIIIIQFTVMI